MTTAPDILAVSAVPALHCDHQGPLRPGRHPWCSTRSATKLGLNHDAVTGSRRSRPRCDAGGWLIVGSGVRTAMIRPVRSVTFPGVDAGFALLQAAAAFLLRHFKPGQELEGVPG